MAQARPACSAHDNEIALGVGRALSGYVDIIIEMTWYARAHEDNRCRKLLAFARYDSTPRRLLIELNPEKTDYVTRGDFVSDEYQDNWPILSGVLEEAHDKLTRKEILKAWPDDFSKP